MTFVKQLLSGDKKAFKNSEVIYEKTPGYIELSIKHIWPEFKNDPEILKYTPDMNPGELPEKQFFFGMLATVYHEATTNLIEKARKIEHWRRWKKKKRW